MERLNEIFGQEWLEFSNRGLRLMLKGDLANFFEEELITDSYSFAEKYHYFRDGVLLKYGLDEIEYCSDSSAIPLGLTECPAFSISFNHDTNDAETFFVFEGYAIIDWVKLLLAEKEVFFRHVK